MTQRDETEPAESCRFDAAWVSRSLEAWFAKEARVLPWREAGPGGRRDPYRALVSEAMLQQTQVSRVEPKFRAFIERFPTIEALAAASEDDVLAMWSGLGYYRRARSLHAAAKQVVERFGGEVPSGVGELIELKGVGRYTAGAIASIVFDVRAPIVDGNVQRVVRRLTGDGRPINDAAAEAAVWADAAALADAADSPSATNEALMELGALVCTPAQPRCMFCPLSTRCRAFADGRQDEVPPPKPTAKKRIVHHAAVLVRDERSRVLVERRLDGPGLWAGMWRPPTLEHDGPKPPSRAAVEATLGLTLARGKPERFTHQTTHREVRFLVYRGLLSSEAGGLEAKSRRFVGAAELDGLALANPHRRMLMAAWSAGEGADR